MPIIISGDTTKSVSLTGDQSKSIQASQVYVPPPAYVVAGLEQSHWDVANAVVSGGLVTSIPDESNIESLTPYQPGMNPMRGTYVSNGWQLNGKTLPTVRRVSDEVLYKADTWATKLSNYTGAYTVATLFRPSFPGSWNTAWYTHFLGSTVTGDSAFGPGYENWWGTYRWTFSRRVNGVGGATLHTDLAPIGVSSEPQLFISEYRGTSFGGTNQSYRFWINGVQQSLSTQVYDSPGAGSFNRFFVMGKDGSSWPAGVDMAQFHIWKGALTDQQRTDVTNYLKSISGIA